MTKATVNDTISWHQDLAIARDEAQSTGRLVLSYLWAPG